MPRRLSKLHRRLENEGDVDNFSGDNTYYSMNFIPAMDKAELMKGYRKLSAASIHPKLITPDAPVP